MSPDPKQPNVYRTHLFGFSAGAAVNHFFLPFLVAFFLLKWWTNPVAASQGITQWMHVLFCAIPSLLISLAAIWGWFRLYAIRLSCYRSEGILHYVSGRWNRREVTLLENHARHIECSRNPLQRLWGSATLIIHVSGVSYGKVKIPDLYLADAVALTSALGHSVDLLEERVHGGS